MELIIIALTAAILNISGAIVIKYITLSFNTPILAAILGIGYILAQIIRIIFWYVIGKKYKLSFIYPFLSITYIISFLLGICLFHEKYTLNSLLGSIVIFLGVLVINLSKNKYEEAL